MKKLLNLILLIAVSIPLASCQNKAKMKTKFEWQESISCPLGYPAEVYRGGLISKDGTYTSIYLGVGHGDWGEGGGGMRGGIKQIPNSLQATWISYAEDRVYEIDTEIDDDKMLKLFNEGYYIPSINENPEPRKQNYDEIIVGLAPGGVVVIWLRGVGRQVEIGRYQGHKTEIPQDEIEGLDDHNRLLFSKERRDQIMTNPKIIPPEVQKENEGKPIPYGLWDFYREKYNWKLEIQLPDEAKVKDIGCFFYNAEHYELFGQILSEKYPNITSNFVWHHDQKTAIPKEINFSWVTKNRYYGEIKFDKKEIFSAFRQIFENNPNAEARLIICVNKAKSDANVRLVSGDKEIWIMENKIVIDKTDFTY